MARQTKDVVITADGRDNGKLFLITELPAVQAERLGMRALMAIGKSGVDFGSRGDELQSGLSGIAALASTGLRALAGVNFDELEPLLDEMMTCVEMVPDAADRSKRLAWPLFGTQIEEARTMLQLRDEVVTLHLGFSPLAILSSWGESAKQAMSNTSNIPTSPPSSESSSAPA